MSALILRIRMFLISYAPLFAILAVRFTRTSVWITFAILAALGILMVALILRAARRIAPSPHTVVEISDQGAEVAGYLATYLLPFLTVAHPSGRDLIAYGLFFAVVGVIYVQSRMLQINPMLYVLGYRVAAVRTSDGWSGYVVARRLPSPGETLLASRLEGTLAFSRPGWTSSDPTTTSARSPSTKP